MHIMKKIRDNKIPRNSLNGKTRFEKHAKKLFALFSCLIVAITIMTIPALAAPETGGDPLTVISNLSEFIFSLTRAVGLILLGFGILQLGLSLKSHNPSQRANGMLTVAGGIVIVFTKEILNLITEG